MNIVTNIFPPSMGREWRKRPCLMLAQCIAVLTAIAIFYGSMWVAYVMAGGQ